MRLLLLLWPALSLAAEYSESGPAGESRWGFEGPDGFHHATVGARGSPVRGSFGHRDVKSGQNFRTEYSAGRAGFVAQGAHITRRGDLGLNARLPPGAPIPRPDKAYDFQYRTPLMSRREAADRWGDVRGRYSYVDDVGLRRTVDYVAGQRTGFLVTSETPDPPVPGSAAEAAFYRPSRPGAPPGPAGTRGYSSSKLSADGSYRFQYSSPDQRRSERKDPLGRVQGEYSFVDDRGERHRVQYEAGAGIGFRVLGRGGQGGGGGGGYPTPYNQDGSAPLTRAQLTSGSANAGDSDDSEEDPSGPRGSAGAATLSPGGQRAAVLGRQTRQRLTTPRAWEPAAPRHPTSTPPTSSEQSYDTELQPPIKTGVVLASPVQLEPVDFFSGEEENTSGDNDRDNDNDNDNGDTEALPEDKSPLDDGASEAESQNPWVISPQSPGDVNRQLFEPRAPQQPMRWGRTQNQVAAQKLDQRGAQWSSWDDPSDGGPVTPVWESSREVAAHTPVLGKRSWTWVAEAERKLAEERAEAARKAEEKARAAARKDPLNKFFVQEVEKKPKDGEEGDEDEEEPEEEEEDSETPAASAPLPSRGSRASPDHGGTPVTSRDLRLLRGLVSSKTPRLAQVISLD